MDYPHTSFYHHRRAAYYQRADFSPAGISVPHIMIALFKRINALFISFVLIGVYGIGVGLARLIYMFSKSKEEKRDSYWVYTIKQRIPDDVFSAY